MTDLHANSSNVWLWLAYIQFVVASRVSAFVAFLLDEDRVVLLLSIHLPCFSTSSFVIMSSKHSANNIVGDKASNIGKECMNTGENTQCSAVGPQGKCSIWCHSCLCWASQHTVLPVLLVDVFVTCVNNFL